MPDVENRPASPSFPASCMHGALQHPVRLLLRDVEPDLQFRRRIRTLEMNMIRVVPSRYVAALVCLLLPVVPAAGAQAQQPPPQLSISSRVAGLARIDGFVPLYWDARQGRLLMEVDRFDTELLYVVSLSVGLGSNTVGLDRGQPGTTQVVVFERVGPQVLLVARNYQFRASSRNPAERQAVADSFASSVLWGFTVDAEENGRVLVDATKFFVRDAHGVAARMRATKQGSFSVDESRSAIYLPRTKGSQRTPRSKSPSRSRPSSRPGPRWNRSPHRLRPSPFASTTPWCRRRIRVTCRAASIRGWASSRSLLRLRHAGHAPLEQRWITRHRLQKKHPSAARSEAVTPIVYYVDTGAPENVRRALIEGASWWNQAFEAAGFIEAFQVRELPAEADPMDVRYNVINWVHRSTRGWSYGSSVVDPRTGEIVKGVVTLDSLRVRQNIVIGSGLESPWAAAGGGRNGAASACAASASPDVSYLVPADSAADVEALALARLRQLSAHEVGHTLGYEHNFAASSYGRASVMDYPAPLVEVRDGRLDLSHAYATGIGEYDKFATRYAYSQFAPGADEGPALDRLVHEGLTAGMLFIDDEDARAADAAHPGASLWDNGPDAAAGLAQQLEVRHVALEEFGMAALPPGLPMSLLEARLLPLYLHHRYQLQATLKSIGGAYFTYAVREMDGGRPPDPQRIVAPGDQRRALDAVLATLDPAVLALPSRVLDLIPPPAFGYRGGIPELFPRTTGPVFDPIAAATTAADLAISGLLQPARAARMELFHARNAANPDFDEVVRSLLRRTWGNEPAAGAPKDGTDGERAAVRRAVQTLVVTRLMDLAASSAAGQDVRAIATTRLRRLASQLASRPDAHGGETRRDIERFLERPAEPRTRTPPPSVPPGEPIGGL